ncbi:23S rRNA (pseudouridine1915-N3)-methyltransferase [Desulfonispora thiosulfatigenes DSM 11270]|uniref:Ribosomal RNA large subunit methyltransferase H n=1 Tax=Desulfonispora thiosulfatigenes DSM 11270 TaxID=656914 RepID=A0A1W1V462_DESTI|nr:23S rRNA (pseudouridine(1915)-N(3))-methyltransferase RlmH [Desulfonispora thiosulfatigenes]SMB87811.1 23S rRNA (pseudouridine1915-N3)-methyltransferase [Desulfonispora thiosulfatigenes DSM 11270]
MNIKIIAVGKIKEKFLDAGIKEYLKRLTSYAKVEIIEVKDEKEPENCSPADEKLIKEKEAQKIEKHIKDDSYIIVLAIDGKMFSSEELATKLNELALNGKSDLTFIIGGSQGLDEKILGQANLKLSFSKMTFPHQLMRLIMLEQIYRGFKIIKGEPYHK